MKDGPARRSGRADGGGRRRCGRHPRRSCEPTRRSSGTSSSSTGAPPTCTRRSAEAATYLAGIGLTADRSCVTNVAIVGLRRDQPRLRAHDRRVRQPGLVACADVVPARATEVAERHGIREVCTLDALLADPEIDAIVNLTPPSPCSRHRGRARSRARRPSARSRSAWTSRSARLSWISRPSRACASAVRPTRSSAPGCRPPRAVIDRGDIGEPLAANAFMLGAGPGAVAPEPGDLLRAGRRSAVRHGSLLLHRARAAARPGARGSAAIGPRPRARSARSTSEPRARRADRRRGADPRGSARSSSRRVRSPRS